jgi:hypothetical protein
MPDNLAQAPATIEVSAEIENPGDPSERKLEYTIEKER